MTLLAGQIEEHSWIPVEERLPEEDEYVLMSFENFTLPIIGRYEKDNDGGGAIQRKLRADVPKIKVGK